MNKKPLIITAISLVAAFTFIGLGFYLQSFKTAHFDLKKDNLKVIIYKNEEEVTTIDGDADVRLQKGDYTYATEGTNFDNTPTSFTVGDTDPDIVINPPYSSAFRNKELLKEISSITQALTEAYPILTTNFTINRGEIYDDGTWYGATFLEKASDPREPTDLYRAVLKKERGVWVVKTKPAIVLSAKEYPDIPSSILSSVNKK